MKSFLTFLALSLLATGAVQSQTRPVTKPTSAPTTTRPVSKPVSTTTTTQTPPAAVSSNRQQELYDQYHGVSKKPASPAPGIPADRPASRPASQPVPSAPVARIERTGSSDGGTSGVRIGIRGGVTRPVYLEEMTDAEPALSFVGGLVFNFGKGALSFQPELNYARYAVKGTEPFSGATVNVAGDRFEVPLFLKLASGPASRSRFFLNIGPYGAYVSSISINGQKASLDGSTGRFSVGAAAGIGAALKAGPGHLTVELRGLYDLGTPDTRLNTDSRVINAQATVGYMIPLGGR